jgi:hypothetical protein
MTSRWSYDNYCSTTCSDTVVTAAHFAHFAEPLQQWQCVYALVTLLVLACDAPTMLCETRMRGNGYYNRARSFITCTKRLCQHHAMLRPLLIVL